MAYWKLMYLPAFGGAEMKKHSVVVVVVVMIVFACVSGAAAQGPAPQGAGADAAAQKSNAPHSYNPIKWIKKDPSDTTVKPKKAKNKKPSKKAATPDAPAPPKS
jgi:hypothetical protein